MTKLMIKNMVCPRCILSVEQLLGEHGLRASAVRLGEVDLVEAPTAERLQQFSDALQKVGFELLDDQKKQLIDRMKTLLIAKVQSGSIEEHFGLSKFLAGALHKDYSNLSRLFSEVEGITLEQYFILQKIEKAKEWLLYREHTLSEIAWRLGYSSTQHLSAQFKKVTGMTPSQFKERGSTLRKPLDDLA
ncbi:helix-turn-helix domain-containing protein [Flaviaesturariibacter terrae]